MIDGTNLHLVRPRQPDEDELRFRAIAAEAAHALDPGDAGNAPYFAWLAREARARQSPVERAATARDAEAFAARWAVRHLAARLRLVLVDGDPPAAPARAVREAPAPGSLRDCVREGRRSERFPLVDARAAAGAGREIWDEPCADWIARPAGVPNGDYLALRVAGDSMTPLLHDADTILLTLGGEPAPDTVVVARLPDDGYVVKRLARVGRDFLELHSVNEAYAPLVVARAEATVLGTVVMRWCAHS